MSSMAVQMETKDFMIIAPFRCRLPPVQQPLRARVYYHLIIQAIEARATPESRGLVPVQRLKARLKALVVVPASARLVLMIFWLFRARFATAFRKLAVAT
jgi:hypothetical protein